MEVTINSPKQVYTVVVRSSLSHNNGFEFSQNDAQSTSAILIITCFDLQYSHPAWKLYDKYAYRN